jgi:hypothetical protein
MLTNLALGRGLDAMVEGQLPPGKPQEKPNPACWDDGDPQIFADS